MPIPRKPRENTQADISTCSLMLRYLQNRRAWKPQLVSSVPQALGVGVGGGGGVLISADKREAKSPTLHILNT